MKILKILEHFHQCHIYHIYSLMWIKIILGLINQQVLHRFVE